MFVYVCSDAQQRQQKEREKVGIVKLEKLSSPFLSQELGLLLSGLGEEENS